MTAGIPARPQVSKHPLMHIAEYSINAVKTGRMQNTDFLKVSRAPVPSMRVVVPRSCGSAACTTSTWHNEHTNILNHRWATRPPVT